ncbi:protein kinase C-binding protein 1 isoform X3 [Spodoptera frugiperda]|uniref:Protein kinase C-binding protein 1 isoform X3 n=1 Tax=Spodoptera frugiperda TaxID=7108 RepID=A0A9R0DUD8_SPOFR|nr:protein kinase C-binding protein 1 isoform X3 [Spodoptera frugiperda]
MDESTENHMETDVSSTTDDVPETQEVTGSDGNVEMIIVVEKMDDESTADEQSDEQHSPVHEGTDSIMTPEDEAPEKEPVSTVKLPLKSPAVSPIKTPTITVVKSPARSPVKSPVKSPAKSPVQSPAKSPIKSPAKPPTITEVDTEVANTTEDTEIVMIVETAPQVPDEVPTPVATQQVEVTVEASPVKESQINETEDKPTQILSPSKEVQKPVPKSPDSELQPSDADIPTPTKETIPNDKPAVNGKVQSNETGKVDDTSVKPVTTVTPIEITIENSNDSQIETLSDISEKEHKGISRELKSLIKSAKESKIISECTQLKSKTRKSRNALDTSSSSLNSSLLEPGKIHDTRRNSDNSQKSNCSEKSDKTHLKRSMRSQNPEFVSKVKQFLNSVTGKSSKDSDDEDDVVESKDKSEILEQDAKGTPPKVKKTEPIVVTENSNKLRSDPYCWRCHWAVEQATKMHPPMHCTVCPRTFHFKCLTGPEKNKINLEKNWVCPECMIVLQAESSETRSPAMKKISLGMLCDLLKHALRRMTETNGVEPFMQPVDRTAFPDYDKYVVHPMDLSLMRDNISEGLYGSTEAFLADAQWILHNSIIFNTYENVCPPSVQSKLTAGARALVRSCRSEMGEIEACPECYAAAHARRPTWFTDVCSTPHILFWAKLKGFPFWPAKGMSVNSSGLVDVRFFGAHDRAWVPSKDCFLYSEKDPNNFRTKRQDIIDSMQEAEQHIRNISRKYGRFVYPPFKTPFEPSRMSEQLKMMIPTFEGDVRSLVKEKPAPAVKGKSRSNSKGSKCSLNDGLRLHSDSTDSGSDGEELQRLYALLDKYSDASETDEAPALPARKMADGAEIAKVEEDESNVEKEVEVEVPVPVQAKTKENAQTPTTTTSRKRRRSDLEEAVITIIETSGSYEKRSRRKSLADIKKPDAPEPSSSKVVDTTTDKPKGEASKTTPKQTTPVKANETLTKLKDTEPSSSTEKEKTQRVTPIRIALVKERRHSTRTSSSKDPTAKIITPNKDKDQEKTTPQRPKSARSAEKPLSATKPEKTKPEKVDKTPNSKAEKADKTPNDKTTRGNRSRAEKRSSSRSSRSTNSTSSTRSSDKAEKKTYERAKDKSKDSKPSAKEKDKDGDANKSAVAAQMSPKPVADVQSPKSVKDRLHFDDDTTLAVLARETSKSNNLVTVTLCNNSGLPTISSVRSLSTTAQATGVTITKTTTNANTIDITEESSTSDSSIFTPTSSENVTSMKEAMSKLQRLRNETAEPVVGRVGVRAFARMTSPERHTPNEEVQVEIKAEPIDLDDPERHMEKMDLMNAFRLRPVNPQNVPTPTMNLRDVRINKVVVTPLNAKKVTKPPEVRPRAKKSFPQPKKPDESRSDLVTKNSMVYIPIQPPQTQAPSARPPRPPHAATPALQPPCIIRPPIATTSSNSLVNTVTTPLMLSSPCISTSGVTNSTSVATVPTVHTVPLMTSVNGQWMFSFQPVMSVGAIDNTPSAPLVNGITDRSNTSVPLATLTPTANSTLVNSASTPAASVVPVLPTATPGPPISVISRTPTENSPGEPPRLQQRPTQCLQNPLDGNTPIGTMPPPSTAGPVTAKLNQNAVKMTDFFRSLLEDSLEKLDEPVSQLTTLKLQLEQDKWRHQQEIKELKHNYELTIAEMRASFEKEKLRAVSEARRASQVELETAVKQTKTKQWCANCSQEAQFYCCWNTAYCGYPCQRAHWSQHFSACQQQRQDGSNGESPTSPKSQSDNMPVLQKTPAPTLTVGGKVAPSRGFNQDPNSASKTSIIVSMVEDTSGNQTMKCVGTYKPVSGGQLAPIINNKPVASNEENQNKKVVSSSGGYLIVGGASNSSVVTPARRTHAIQYFS